MLGFGLRERNFRYVLHTSSLSYGNYFTRKVIRIQIIKNILKYCDTIYYANRLISFRNKVKILIYCVLTNVLM